MSEHVKPFGVKVTVICKECGGDLELVDTVPKKDGGSQYHYQCEECESTRILAKEIPFTIKEIK